MRHLFIFLLGLFFEIPIAQALEALDPEKNYFNHAGAPSAFLDEDWVIVEPLSAGKSCRPPPAPLADWVILDKTGAEMKLAAQPQKAAVIEEGKGGISVEFLCEKLGGDLYHKLAEELKKHKIKDFSLSENKDTGHLNLCANLTNEEIKINIRKHRDTWYEVIPFEKFQTEAFEKTLEERLKHSHISHASFNKTEGVVWLFGEKSFIPLDLKKDGVWKLSPPGPNEQVPALLVFREKVLEPDPFPFPFLTITCARSRDPYLSDSLPAKQARSKRLSRRDFKPSR